MQQERHAYFDELKKWLKGYDQYVDLDALDEEDEEDGVVVGDDELANAGDEDSEDEQAMDVDSE